MNPLVRRLRSGVHIHLNSQAGFPSQEVYITIAPDTTAHSQIGLSAKTRLASLLGRIYIGTVATTQLIQQIQEERLLWISCLACSLTTRIVRQNLAVLVVLRV